VPNYTSALSVHECDVTALDERTFRTRFVNRNRPCHIRGAARHWPAFRAWQSIDHLKALCGSAKVPVHRVPRVEGDSTIFSADKKRRLEEMRDEPEVMPCSEFLDRASAAEEDETELFFLYSMRTTKGAPLECLAADIGTFPFLQRPPRSLLNIYPQNSIYLYRSAVTDWHYHASAEALQTQIRGTKEVILLPPSDEVWTVMSALQREVVHTYDADIDGRPGGRDLVPYRVLLQPGDALYIPNHWWHLVSTVGHRSLGATVPTWWDSPLHVQLDLRFPAARQSMKSLVSGALPLRKTCLWLPTAALGVAWAYTHRVFRPADRPWFLSAQLEGKRSE
jgi:quercetin dioxygenase-like cupin family protein